MSNFGKYAILDNVRHTLEREPEMWWEFKAPTAKEEIAINRFTQGNSVKQSASGIERKIVTNAEIALEELTLTYADSNFVDDEGHKLISNNDSPDHIREIIRTFPKEMFFELWRGLGEACPGWGALPATDNKDTAEVGPKK